MRFSFYFFFYDFSVLPAVKLTDTVSVFAKTLVFVSASANYLKCAVGFVIDLPFGIPGRAPVDFAPRGSKSFGQIVH